MLQLSDLFPLLFFVAAVALATTLMLNKQLKAEIRNRTMSDMIFQSSADMICVLGSDGLLKLANPACANETGYDASELLGSPVGMYIHPDDRRGVLRQAMKALRSGELFHGEFRYLRKDGSERTASWTAAPIAGMELICVIGRDVTEKRQMEAGLLRLDRLDLAGQMAASISHELRNPMTTVRGFLQMMMIKETDPKHSEYYALMIAELDRANSIITEFLSLARNRMSDKRPQHLDDVIKVLLPLIEAEVMMEGKYVISDIRSVPEALLDEKEVKQLLLNLVKNAREATPQAGLVTIKTHSDARAATLSVVNNGPPIPADVLAKLGTPFFTTKQEGTGLGLSVCYRIAQRHNAEIIVQSNESETRFDVVFPLG